MGLRILVVGASGTIGAAVARALERDHDVLRASRRKSPLTADLTDAESIRALFRRTGPVDAVVSCAGDARFKPFAELTDEDFV
ncbi:MAG TPA: SDR family NAD(P)-dependent oxidoreductase, partial [Thermoanaerobaculia bacterium]|nr:SDR family NAD(P)-dependent oxidoreductase [Thermoanaerobaculia bacterium]